MANWAQNEIAFLSGNFQRSIAVMIATIPEALPTGTLFIALILMDAAFAMFGGGLLLTQGIATLIRSRGTPPAGFSLQQCSPWTSQATVRAATAAIAQLQGGATRSAMWVSTSMAIICFAIAYIITSVKLLESTFDTRIATYANATIPAATMACIAVLLGYTCFLYFTGCDNVMTLLVGLLLGGGLGVGWAFAAYAISPQLVNLVHIPLSTTAAFNRSVVLCAGPAGPAGQAT